MNHDYGYDILVLIIYILFFFGGGAILLIVFQIPFVQKIIKYLDEFMDNL